MHREIKLHRANLVVSGCWGFAVLTSKRVKLGPPKGLNCTRAHNFQELRQRTGSVLQTGSTLSGQLHDRDCPVNSDNVHNTTNNKVLGTATRMF